MKNLSFPQSLLLFVFCVLLFSNCRNRSEIVDPINLLGRWNAIAYKIDSEEQIGNTFNSVVLNFGPISDGVGPFALVTEETNGSSMSQGGEYSLDIDFTKLYLTIAGTTTEYAISFNDDFLRMQGVDEDNRTIDYDCEKVE